MKKVQLIQTIEAFRVSDGQRVIINADADSIDGLEYMMRAIRGAVQAQVDRLENIGFS